MRLVSGNKAPRGGLEPRVIKRGGSLKISRKEGEFRRKSKKEHPTV